MNRSSLPRGFRSIVFDCDSTLCAIEGIEVLAGARVAEVAALTEAAMEGALPLEDVYARRLELIQPQRDAVDALARAYIETLVPDARETIAALLWLDKAVRIVSGGLRPPVEALARELGLAVDAVGAVGIEFHEDGSYAGFEQNSPLARSGGKSEVIRGWQLPHPTLLVGDGATDLEARPAVDAFAAYMGVVHRPAVAAGADVVLLQSSLAPVLALAADPEEHARLRDSQWKVLLARGEELLNFNHEF